MDKQIFWVASYPKSGNTLLRSILSSIFFSKDGLFNFKLLKQNEAKFGFSESENRQFFRKGTSDQWQDILNKDQIFKIEQNFSTLMKKFGYKTIYHNE